MQRVKVSIEVIIVTRNRSDKVLRAVRAVLAGVRMPDKLTIIDSSAASTTDVQKDVAAACRKKEVSHVWKHITHRGISYARNVGIRTATKDIFCFLDDDELPDAHWVHTIALRFTQMPELLALTGLKLGLYPENYWTRVWASISETIYPKRSGWVKFVSAGNSCYRRARLRSLNFLFDERMTGAASEDSVMSTHFYRAGIRIYFDQKLIVRHEFRTDLFGFATQWFRYGNGTFHYHRLYSPTRRRHVYQYVLHTWEMFWFSYSHVRVKNPDIGIRFGLFVRDIMFAWGFLYGMFTGRQ